MSDLSSKFTREDIETLIEATGDWEAVGNHDFHVLNMIKNMPMPPEDHEAFEQMQQVKDHFKKREKEILASRTVRQERAVFLKAKLMLVRKDLGISALFDMASCADPNSPPPKPQSTEPSGWDAPPAKKKSKAKAENAEAVSTDVDALTKKLELAEFFIKDLSLKVWESYQKFLAEKAEEATEKTD